MADWDLRQFERQLHEARSRASSIAGEAAAGSEEDALETALAELGTAFEELRVADEQMRFQQEELLLTRAELEAERSRYQHLFEYAPLAYLVTDHHGRVVNANVAACRLLGVNSPALKRKPLASFVQESDRRMFRTHFDRILHEAGTHNWEMRLKPRGAAPVWVAVSVAALPDGPEAPTALYWLLHDVSDRKENERLDRAVVEAHHRIKNSLQLIAGLVDIELLEARNGPLVDPLQRIGRQIRGLAVVHDAILAGTRGRGEEVVSARTSLSKLVPLLEALAEPRPVTLDATDVPLSVRQASALVMLVNELVSNSVKHGRGPIEVSLTEKGGQTHLTVCDGGDGFPPGFDPERAANIGLELVARLARTDLEGEVRFENKPDGGARVQVVFPAGWDRRGTAGLEER